MDYRKKSEKKAHKAELWFERDVFKNLIDEKDEDADLDRMVKEYKKKGAKVIGEEDDKPKQKPTKTKQKSKPAQKSETTDSDYSSDESSDESDSESGDSDYDIEKAMHVPVNDSKKDGFEVVKSTANAKRGKKYKLNEEELALGTMMINSKKTKRDLIDAAWNRYAFNDSNLPDWFVQDEQKHMKLEAPVPKVRPK